MKFHCLDDIGLRDALTGLALFLVLAIGSALAWGAVAAWSFITVSAWLS